MLRILIILGIILITTSFALAAPTVKPEISPKQQEMLQKMEDFLKAKKDKETQEQKKIISKSEIIEENSNKITEKNISPYNCETEFSKLNFIINTLVWGIQNNEQEKLANDYVAFESKCSTFLQKGDNQWLYNSNLSTAENALRKFNLKKEEEAASAKAKKEKLERENQLLADEEKEKNSNNIKDKEKLEKIEKLDRPLIGKYMWFNFAVKASLLEMMQIPPDRRIECDQTYKENNIVVPSFEAIISRRSGPDTLLKNQNCSFQDVKNNAVVINCKDHRTDRLFIYFDSKESCEQCGKWSECIYDKSWAKIKNDNPQSFNTPKEAQKIQIKNNSSPNPGGAGNPNNFSLD